MVVCLERGADLHMAQLMPLPLTVSCFSKIQVWFTFLVPAHPGSPWQRAIKRLCACVCVSSGAVDSHSPAGRPQGSSAFTDHNSRDVDWLGPRTPPESQRQPTVRNQISAEQQGGQPTTQNGQHVQSEYSYRRPPTRHRVRVQREDYQRSEAERMELECFQQDVGDGYALSHPVVCYILSSCCASGVSFHTELMSGPEQFSSH